ncbi:MAG: hypothetical protein ABIE68_01765 [bacterium]
MIRRDIEKVINQYVLNVEALRDFINLIEVFERNKKQIIKKNPHAYLALLQFEIEKDLSLSSIKGDDLKRLKEMKKRISKLCSKKYKIKKEEGSVSLLTSDYNAYKEIEKTEKDMNLMTIGRKFIIHSTLMNLISVYEKLLVDLIYYINGINKEIFISELSNHEITIKDLDGANNVEEIRYNIVSLYINDLLRNDKIEIVDILMEKSSLSAEYWNEYKINLIEVKERRNIFVHNDGMVNKEYLDKVDKKLIKKHKAEIGKRLNTTTDYISDSLDLFEATGVYIAAKIWKKFDNNNTDRSLYLTSKIIYQRLLENRNFVAEHLAEFVMRDDGSEAIIKDMGQLNYWLAKKQDGKYSKIKDDVMKMDYSDKGRKLQLGLLALQKKKEEFFLLLSDAIKKKDISMEQYMEFPIFKDMRRTKASRDFIEKHEKKTKK